MQVWRLVSAWIRMGHQADIAGHRIPSKFHNGVRLINLPVFYRAGRVVRALSYFFSLARHLLVSKKNYDLIYCRFLGEAALSVVFLKKVGLLSLPMVAVPAAAGINDKSDVALLRSLPANQIILRAINRHCDCVNFIAPGIKQSLSSIGLKPKLAVEIPNGVPVSSEIASGPVDKVVKLVFVGRLAHQKGIDILFQALSLLKKSEPVFEITLIGNGPDRKRLEDLADQLSLSNCVLFRGEQSEDKIRIEMINAHLFVLPSRYEGMSNAALEALSYGLPCILTACGGIDTHITPNTGWVCEPGNPQDLYRALSEAGRLTSEKWRKMSTDCRTLIQENFALEWVARKNMELFEALC